MNSDASQFRVFRILFGAYLTIHFAMLVPYANELFGATGILADPTLNPTHGLFPNPLNFALPMAWVAGVLVFLTMLSVLFTFDIARPAVAILLWFGWTALFHRNNLIANPSIPYIGLLLVLCALVPTGKLWVMPHWIPRCAWILLAVGYTFSGITKLGSPSWIDGSAISFLIHNPLARPGVCRDMLLAMPDVVPQLLTWGTLGIEILFAPLVLSRRLRPWVWLATCGLHLGIIAVVDFADLSLGMLMVHAFTFDRRWLGLLRRDRSALFREHHEGESQCATCHHQADGQDWAMREPCDRDGDECDGQSNDGGDQRGANPGDAANERQNIGHHCDRAHDAVGTDKHQDDAEDAEAEGERLVRALGGIEHRGGVHVSIFQ